MRPSNTTLNKPKLSLPLLRSWGEPYNVVTVADSEDKAYSLCQTSKNVLMKCGFNLRNFCSISMLLRRVIDKQENPEPQSTFVTPELNEGGHVADHCQLRGVWSVRNFHRMGAPRWPPEDYSPCWHSLKSTANPGGTCPSSNIGSTSGAKRLARISITITRSFGSSQKIASSTQ